MISCRNFATATRNYARRQINWYRRDQKFLFLQINRERSTSAKEPYLKIVDELLHYTLADRVDYEMTLSRQIQYAKYYQQLIEKKRLPNQHIEASHPSESNGTIHDRNSSSYYPFQDDIEHRVASYISQRSDWKDRKIYYPDVNEHTNGFYSNTSPWTAEGKK